MAMIKYMHVERVDEDGGPDEIRGLGENYVFAFPKLDGANHCIWFDKEKNEVRCASRNNILSEGYDSTKFYHNFFMGNENVKKMAKSYPNYIFYGEYLTPHTLKDYKDEAWNRWYVFDVVEVGDNGEIRYVPFNDYEPILLRYNVDMIPPIGVLFDPSYEDMKDAMKYNTFMLKEGAVGEGLVFKNYDFKNKWGHTIWGKIVDADFKERSKSKNKGEGELTKEEKFVYDKLTPDFVSKEKYKYLDESGETWSDNLIKVVLPIIREEFIKDYSNDILSEFKNEEIDMKLVNKAISKYAVRYIRM